MYTYQQVNKFIEDWKSQEIGKSDLVVKIAESCLGWPYVWGAYGQYCVASTRKSYANRDSISAAEAQQIINKCKLLSGFKGNIIISGGSCSGCKYYPGGVVRIFDCRGFTRWVLLHVLGYNIQGAGATSQWNTGSNWVKKGPISEMPKDQVCCIFMQNQKDHKTMEHTGFHVGGGEVIHCSGEVKRGKITDKGWTHYAIPKGLDGKVSADPMSSTSTPTNSKPTIHRGSKGEYVTLLQTALLNRGYDLGSYGADGAFGAKTEAAVKQFQKKNGLTEDGIVGPKTWEALDKGDVTPVKYYTVHIPGLPESQAEDLKNKYTDAWKTED